MITLKKFLFALLMVVVLASCDNEDDTPTPANSATFTITIENLLSPKDFLASGGTGLIMPGQQETFTFHAGKGSYLSLATMFVQSNDLFYAFDEKGLSLYDDNGNPLTGDVTSMIDLWDAGTEVNEAPGSGPNQAPRQSGPNTGAEENGTIGLVTNSNDGFTYPADEQIIRISLTHDGGTMFTATLENISASSTLPTPFAPGVWAIHGGNVQLFQSGEAADAGLEGIAEDGNNAETIADLEANTGYSSPLAPGVWVVHEAGTQPLFVSGQPDAGLGLEALAEDGDPSGLSASLASLSDVEAQGVFNTPIGESSPGPLLPGGMYSFTFDAEDGDYLNLATMLVHTNDLFFAFGSDGIPLFANGAPISGDISADLQLWDAGTEVNEYPGAGNNQPARGGAQSGAPESDVLRTVDDGFTYPAVNEAIRVRVEFSN